MYLKIFAQMGAALLLYWGLNSLIDNNVIVIAILIGIIFLIIIYGIYVIGGNPADLLEIVVDYPKYILHIEKYNEEPSKYHLLKAYGLVYAGKFDEARTEYANVAVKDLKENKHLVFIKTVVDLKFAFENQNADLFKGILFKATEDKVFENVELPNDLFKAHLAILEADYKKAEKLCKEVIPVIKKRLFIIELEYLLAVSYFELNKLDDCSAVCEFVVEKNYQVEFTEKCSVMYNKVNRK